MKRWAGMMLGALLCGAGVPGVAGAAAVDKADPKWLRQCIDANVDRLGTAKCLVDHREALRAAQAATLARINKKLAGKAPDGIDYAAAAKNLAEAQRHWQAFLGADCAIVDVVEALAGEDCVIKHYTTRNAQLRELETGYL